jgi:hypothetical protein
VPLKALKKQKESLAAGPKPGSFLLTERFQALTFCPESFVIEEDWN